MLDRLVRQGRAFGLHVLLGSQTLGGAYSLARSTIDQMAVRIALQCSDADAQLILSKDNTAARLLSRPGEAIYNDQNGLVEGNDPFQVVWLSEEKREKVLEGLHERAGDKWPPPLVFAGNMHADLANNHLLTRQMASPAIPKAPAAWLGEPVAIKDPTAATFRSLGGANLLVIGQNEEAARGLFTALCVSLAAQLPPAATADRSTGGVDQATPIPAPSPLRVPAFTIFDGTPDDADDADFFVHLASRLPGAAHAGPRGSGTGPGRARRRDGSPPSRRVGRSLAALPARIRRPSLPRPSKGGGGFRIRPARRRRARALARRALQRPPSRRPARWDSRRRLVRFADQPQPHLRPAAGPRVRAPRAVPDQRHRFQRTDGHPRRGQVGPHPGALPHRGNGARREVPAIWAALDGMARSRRANSCVRGPG